MYPKPLTLCHQGKIRFIIPLLIIRENDAESQRTFVVDRNEWSRAETTA